MIDVHNAMRYDVDVIYGEHRLGVQADETDR